MLTEQEKKRLQSLSDEEVGDELHSRLIEDTDRAFVFPLLPSNMKLNQQGFVKYRMGQAPASKQGLEQGKHHQYPPGVSGNQGRTNHKRKPLQEAFKDLLDSETQDATDDESPSRLIKVSTLLAKMQLQALKTSFKHGSRTGDLGTFSRILSEFRVAAGEMPTQETDNTNRDEGNPYLNASVQELVKVTQALLERANTTDRPPNKQIPVNVTIHKGNDNK